MTFPRPRILVSKCIEFDHCRYDGSMINSKLVEDLKNYVDFVPVCAEMEIGLPSPRQSLRLIGDEQNQKLVRSADGLDYTEQMDQFSKKFLKEQARDIDGAIIKSKSPSCGLREVKVYQSFGKSSVVTKKAQGRFGKALTEKYPWHPIEDEARLGNFSIRESFLTRIFLIAKFKSNCGIRKMKDLVDFHSRNKYMLMMYNQAQLKVLGNLVANKEKRKPEEVYDLYYENLLKAIWKNPSYKTKINILLHIFGYFSKELKDEERIFFLDNLERYRDSKVPFSVPLNILHSWAIRFDIEYLKNQTIFNAFPPELITVTDSGKGRER